MISSLVQSLHRSEESRLRRFFERRLRHQADAADATQETFLRLLMLPPHTTIESPRAYLFRTARSVLHRLASKAALAPPTEPLQDAAEQACAQPGPERIAADREQLALLIAAIRELPPRCRTVFLLSRADGLSNGEIALRLRISRNMVEKHIMRALLHCRDVQRRLAEPR
ncbi:RNA polymerase sigma factor [Roseococcus pinisoli]|uniref:Sigma-70 family RNA polymerase sigma factor n=1 Tax=Roseococcus pinisoli TaxID=2835040 RepID=A0ABS5QJ27_9PROT|nr:sigma-70 family RNA polymerase sigma factor [uncultured Roseococcus sp.]MBS7813624.1 sigma-70 family RNA polymerase sigma factor [Roseococcus pinisoli]